MLAPWAQQSAEWRQVQYDRQAVLQPVREVPEVRRLPRSRFSHVLQGAGSAPASANPIEAAETPDTEPNGEADTCALALAFHANPLGDGGALEAFGLTEAGDIVHAYQRPLDGWSEWASLLTEGEPARRFRAAPSTVRAPRLPARRDPPRFRPDPD